MFVGGFLVAHGTHPGGLLLVHLDVERGVEALQVRTRQRSAGHRQPHLPQLCGGGFRKAAAKKVRKVDEGGAMTTEKNREDSKPG